MKRSHLKSLYLTACAVLVAALVGVTALVVAQAQSHARATADALFHEDVRTAMWRMETRVSAMVATTTVTGRVSGFTPFSVGTYSNNVIEPAQNSVNDLDAPVGPLRAEIEAAADEAFMVACSGLGDVDVGASPESWTRGAQGRGAKRSQAEFLARQSSSNVQQVVSQNRGVPGADQLTMGPLVPVWREGDGPLQLYLARRVQSPEGTRHESYRLAWDELEDVLLAEITDLFPNAELVPLTEPAATQVLDAARTEPTEDDAFRLAAVPVRLEVKPVFKPKVAAMPLLTLGIGWMALLSGLVLGWGALRASVAYGDKHRRFTHAVTHELRTPLTTFRMYSEMLAKGMVPEAAIPEYLSSLESESVRLSGLVENVLRYAQLEEGERATTLTQHSPESLAGELQRPLAEICDRAGAELSLGVDPVAPTGRGVDVAAVTQIASNLVENACKYGRRAGEPARVEVWISGDAKAFTVEVRDAGPGITPSAAKRIFEPFDRAGRDSSDEAPGVGLGLALSRDLARALGGELVLLPSDRGARFRLAV